MRSPAPCLGHARSRRAKEQELAEAATIISDKFSQGHKQYSAGNATKSQDVKEDKQVPLKTVHGSFALLRMTLCVFSRQSRSQSREQYSRFVHEDRRFLIVLWLRRYRQHRFCHYAGKPFCRILQRRSDQLRRRQNGSRECGQMEL